MIEQKLLKILVCPQCKGELEYKTSPEELICQPCKLAYTVKENIPVMLIEEARKL